MGQAYFFSLDSLKQYESQKHKDLKRPISNLKTLYIFQISDLTRDQGELWLYNNWDKIVKALM